MWCCKKEFMATSRGLHCLYQHVYMVRSDYKNFINFLSLYFWNNFKKKNRKLCVKFDWITLYKHKQNFGPAHSVHARYLFRVMINFFHTCKKMASLSSSNQQCVWWFSTSSDKQLLFKKNFTTDFLVHSVKAGFEQKTIDIVMQSVVSSHIFDLF